MICNVELIFRGHRLLVPGVQNDSPGRYQQLDLFIKVLRLLCPNLTDAKSFWIWNLSVRNGHAWGIWWLELRLSETNFRRPPKKRIQILFAIHLFFGLRNSSLGWPLGAWKLLAEAYFPRANNRFPSKRQVKIREDHRESLVFGNLLAIDIILSRACFENMSMASESSRLSKYYSLSFLWLSNSILYYK